MVPHVDIAWTHNFRRLVKFIIIFIPHLSVSLFAFCITVIKEDYYLRGWC